MSFYFYHLLSWSERSKIFPHTIKGTLPHESLDVILLSGVSPLPWGAPANSLLCVNAEHSSLQRSDWGQEPVTSVWNSSCCLLPAGLHSQMGQDSTDPAAAGGKKKDHPIYWVMFFYRCGGMPAWRIKSSKQDSQPLSRGKSSTHCSGTCSRVSSWVTWGSSHHLCSAFIIQLVMAPHD